MGQADCENLVRPDREVVALRRIEHVVETETIRTDEAAEAGPRLLGERIKHPTVAAEPGGEVKHGAERVVPEGVDLDRLAHPRRHDPVADLRVHPSQLDAGLARPHQAVRFVEPDAVSRAIAVGVYDRLQDW